MNTEAQKSGLVEKSRGAGAELEDHCQHGEAEAQFPNLPDGSL